jgi:hypothetical protein
LFYPDGFVSSPATTGKYPSVCAYASHRPYNYTALVKSIKSLEFKTTSKNFRRQGAQFEESAELNPEA